MLVHFIVADRDRMKFMKSQPRKHSAPITVKRRNVFDEVISLYRDQPEQLLGMYPFRVEFVGERAIDAGGVSRDMFSAFYEMAYEKLFDGSSLLCPVVHPDMDVSMLSAMGCVISHAYLVTGLLPIQIAFPCLAQSLLGLSVFVPQSVLFDSLVDSISNHEAGIIRQALGEINAGVALFSLPVKSGLLSLLSRFNSRHLPTPQNFQKLIVNVAKYEFISKPAAALSLINRGIPVQHQPFWESMELPSLLSVYKAQSVSSAMILEMFSEAEGQDASQERVLGYLRQFIGNTANDELRTFLRFVTGSSACSSLKVDVTFNTLAGLSRRPIAHTCSPSLELSSTYATYQEFVTEFKTCLFNEHSWIMDAV